MHLPPTVLAQPADEGARLLALQHLKAARAARTRLATPGDLEALHDYRVALRRLRSGLRSYRRELRASLTRKSRRRLERLARATNQSRDLEAHLAWLSEEAAAAGPAERPGIAWLIARLEGTQRRARPEMLAIEQRLFPVVHDRLRRQLSRYGSPARLDSRGGRRTTAEATARRVAEAARRLERRLRRIETAADEAAIHRARISAKHLRYLLDPFVAVIPGGDVIVSRLRALQDVFGDVHDAHVFRPELATALAEAERQRQADLLPGIRSLIVSLGARGEAAFAIAAREWLVPARRAFFEELRAESRLLARRACRRRSPVARRWRSRRAVALVSG
jgi:CHAD domain-containing protein